jgi:hypothetical protein
MLSDGAWSSSVLCDCPGFGTPRLLQPCLQAWTQHAMTQLKHEGEWSRLHLLNPRYLHQEERLTDDADDKR